MRSFRGHDPYDALRGTRLPAIVRRTPKLRQLAIQLRRRCPMDLASLYGIEPFVMAKSVAGYLAGHSRRTFSHGDIGAGLPAAQEIADALFRADGNLGDGAWGYEFDVQTRWAYYPAGSPNLIATVFVGTALMEAGLVFGRDDWIGSGIEAARFVLRELFDPADQSRQAVFRYTSETQRVVHNANLLAAGMLAVADGISPDAGMTEAVRLAVPISVSSQQDSGRWSYGVGAGLHWADNFHTAYNLIGLLQVRRLGIPGVADAIERGVDFWVDTFFGPDGTPYYFDDRRYPYDIHSAATAVDVAGRLSLAGYDTQDTEVRCAHWLRGTLLHDGGRTGYAVHRWYTDNRNFIRWGDSHWEAAQGTEALIATGAKYPLWRVSGVI